MSRPAFSAMLLAFTAIFTIARSAPLLDNVSQFDDLKRPSLFEGDIAGIAPKNGFSSSVEVAKYFLDASVAKNGVITDRWTDNTLYYAISKLFSESETAVIERAVAEINGNATNFKLAQRTDATRAHYVFLGRGGPNTGCWSYVGMIGGRQELNLEVAATPGAAHCMHHGIIIHEIMHAIGFWHEQSRTDRDDHVEINWDNIETSQQHNFLFYEADEITDFGEKYDYGSIMHYGRYDFAVNRTLWTIRPRAPLQETAIGQRKGLSPVDIIKLNAMYSALAPSSIRH